MKKILNAFGLLFINVAIGAVFYTVVVEKYSVIDAIYVSSMTVTTIGFGDITPTNFYSRLFTTFYAIFGTLLTARSLSYLSEVFFQYIRLKKEELVFSRMMHISTFLEMSNGSENVTKERFVLYKLLLLDLVDIKVIAKAESQFEVFDKAHRGSINAKDVCTLPILPQRKDTVLASLARQESTESRVRSSSLMRDIKDRLASELLAVDTTGLVEGSNASDDGIRGELDDAVADELDLLEELEEGARGRRNTIVDVLKYMKATS